MFLVDGVEDAVLDNLENLIHKIIGTSETGKIIIYGNTKWKVVRLISQIDLISQRGKMNIYIYI